MDQPSLARYSQFRSVLLFIDILDRSRNYPSSLHMMRPSSLTHLLQALLCGLLGLVRDIGVFGRTVKRLGLVISEGKDEEETYALSPPATF